MPPTKYSLIPDCCICQDINCTVPFGLCHCGCKRETKISRRSKLARREMKGLPQMYIFGHINRRARFDSQPEDESIRHIHLTKNHVTVVDASDYLSFGAYTYHLNSSGYAMRHLCDKQGVVLHREIMNPPAEMQVDHINGNRLDNRRSNLRICTAQHNSWNRRIGSKNTSGYVGVHWVKASQSWAVVILVNGVRKHLGRFKNKLEAIRIRREAELLFYGEYAQVMDDQTLFMPMP